MLGVGIIGSSTGSSNLGNWNFETGEETGNEGKLSIDDEPKQRGTASFVINSDSSMSTPFKNWKKRQINFRHTFINLSKKKKFFLKVP